VNKEKYEVSIVCCYYNEINILRKKFKNFIDETRNFNFTFEIIIADNNSSDGTTNFLKEIVSQKIKDLKVIFNPKNIGKGGSIKKCSEMAEGKYIAVFDLDEYYTDDLKSGIQIIKNKELDFLVGSRALVKKKYVYGRNYYGVIFLTKLINFFFKTNLTDAAGATKIYKKENYDQININTNGFDFEFDLICKFAKMNYKIDEYPAKYEPRTFAEGKKVRAIRDGTKILITILLNVITPKKSFLRKK
jgi:dolichol-phosphate mannosyltransferase